MPSTSFKQDQNMSGDDATSVCDITEGWNVELWNLARTFWNVKQENT